MDQRARRLMDEVIDYNKPYVCSKCGELMVYAGIGEYKCPQCKFVDYDDYGKVRKYLETHKGAKAIDVELDTGVTQKNIRNMIKESKLQVIGSSRTFWEK